jgi:hypothetical protein
MDIQADQFLGEVSEVIGPQHAIIEAKYLVVETALNFKLISMYKEKDNNAN